MKTKFIFTENVYKIFEYISTLSLESFLLHTFDSQKSASLIFYMNDFFENFSNFESLFIFSKDHSITSFRESNELSLDFHSKSFNYL